MKSHNRSPALLTRKLCSRDFRRKLPSTLNISSVRTTQSGEVSTIKWPAFARMLMIARAINKVAIDHNVRRTDYRSIIKAALSSRAASLFIPSPSLTTVYLPDGCFLNVVIDLSGR